MWLEKSSRQREPVWPGSDPGWQISSPPLTSVSWLKKKKRGGRAGGYVVSKFLFQALKIYDVKVVICKSISVLFGIFKKTHIKSRIYKTDQCSGDFSSAKEFLEPLLEWAGVRKIENVN